jgi:hypothetical protein
VLLRFRFSFAFFLIEAKQEKAFHPFFATAPTLKLTYGAHSSPFYFAVIYQRHILQRKHYSGVKGIIYASATRDVSREAISTPSSTCPAFSWVFHDEINS